MEWLLIFFKISDIIKNGHIWALSVKTMPYKSLEIPLKHLGKWPLQLGSVNESKNFCSSFINIKQWQFYVFS